MLSAVFAVVSLVPSFINGAPQLYTDITQACPSSTSSGLSFAPVQIQTTPSQTVFRSPSCNTLVMAYYPDWVSDTFPPEAIDFTRIDWVDFAFAVPDENHVLTWDDPGAPALLHRLVTAAHAKGSKVKLSVGGWSGSKYFSTAVESPASRAIFADNIVTAWQLFGVDGFDFDWEYPGTPGNPGNIVSPYDSANFLAFLQLLRESLPPSAILTAATPTTPWVGSDGQSMKDVSDFAQVLDRVNIMNYDNWCGTSTPGANAPLYDGCGNSTQKQSNAVAAYDAWTSAGFAPSQLVLGLPAYGYVYRSVEKTLRTRSHSRLFQHATRSLISLKSDGDAQVTFNQLVQQGALFSTDNQTFDGSGGFENMWDECSATPYLVSSASQQVVSYDDPKSIRMKAQFAKEMGMKGVSFWDITGDWNWVLIDTARHVFCDL